MTIHRHSEIILKELKELTEKRWYIIHMGKRYKLYAGEIEIVPEGSDRYGPDVVNERIWEQAVVNANRIEQEHDDLGPWDDFEWGMINGKIAALNWIFGDDWDTLDT